MNSTIAAGVFGAIVFAIIVPPFALPCLIMIVVFLAMGRAGDAVQEQADKALDKAETPAARVATGTGASCALVLITVAAVGVLLLAASVLAPVP